MSGSPEPSAMRLWDQAMAEHPNDLYARRRRYHDLMVEHGHIVCSTCGRTRNDPRSITCSSAFHLTEQSDELVADD